MACRRVYRASLLARLASGLYRRGRILPGKCGFFGNMFMTLNGVRLCEAAGVLAEPVWDERCLYFDPKMGGNAWNYYFQPVAETMRATGSTDARRAGGRALTFRSTADAIYPRYPSMGIRHSYASVIARCVRLLPQHREQVDRTAAELFGDRQVIGVHVRQTDAAAGFENRKGFDFEDYFLAIERQLETRAGALIFLATDSVPAVDAFKQRFGGRVTGLDCIRSTDHVSVHGHYDGGVPGSPYQKGLEVIRDAYLLARVNHLVCVDSRVTAYSLCLNLKLTCTNLSSAPLPWLTETA